MHISRIRVRQRFSWVTFDDAANEMVSCRSLYLDAKLMRLPNGIFRNAIKLTQIDVW